MIPGRADTAPDNKLKCLTSNEMRGADNSPDFSAGLVLAPSGWNESHDFLVMFSLLCYKNYWLSISIDFYWVSYISSNS